MNNANPVQRQPLFNIAPVTLVTLLMLAAVQLIRTFYLSPEQNQFVVMLFGFIPARFHTMMTQTPWAWMSLVTYAFLHFGWAHFLMNSAGLAAFGSVVERTVGKLRLLFILLCGVVSGALLHLLLFSHSDVILGGISAGLSALLAIVLAIIQHSRGGYGWRSLVTSIISWVLVNAVIGLMGLPGTIGQSSLAIAWVAHLGGFIAGLVWLPILWPHYRWQTTTIGDAS